MTRNRALRHAVALGSVLALATGVAAQQATESDILDVSLAPIECWTRTSTRSVRVGEPFTLVLTCAVIDTQATTVVPDQSRLDPSVLQVPPFEVVDGSQARDVRTSSHRFFQYEYNVRFFGETTGAEIELPGPTITYRVQSRVQADAAVEGRERQYDLPSTMMRIVSLVPAGATDIRDQSPETFLDIEARRFRADSLRVVGWVLFGLAGITAMFAATALVRGPKAAAAARHLASARAVLAGAERTLARVRHERQIEGWTSDRIGAALAALRIAASYAVSRSVAQVPAPRSIVADTGQLAIRSGWLRRRSVLVSGSATAGGVAQHIQSHEREGGGAPEGLIDLVAALERFGAAAFGRAGAPDSVLDDALDQGTRAVRAIARQHGYIASTVRRLQESVVGLQERVWGR